MKILYLITQSELGGAQKNVLDLAFNLKNDLDIMVAAGPDGDNALFEQLEQQNIKFYRLKYLRRAINPLFDWLAYREIKKLLQAEQPNILHLHSSKAGVLGSLAAKKYSLSKLRQPAKRVEGSATAFDSSPTAPRSGNNLKVIYTVHGAVFTAAFSAFYRWLFLWLEKWTARYKNKIICVSQNDKNLWLKYNAAPAEKLVVIHNGIDSDNLHFLSREEARKKLKTQDTRNNNQIKIIGTIANFYPEKGLEYLIKAVKRLPTTRLASQAERADYRLPIKLIIIGEGGQRPTLEGLIKKYNLQDTVILTGAINNASRYLKAFDIFVLPSIKEGLPYTILEAMAAGVPIVASDIGGIPEMMIDNFNGFLVPPANPRILAEKTAEILTNPELAQKFSQNSLIKIREFSLAKMLTATKNIYQTP